MSAVLDRAWLLGVQWPTSGDSELIDEFLDSLERVKQCHLDYLIARGVTGRSIIDVGLVGAMPIETNGLLYQPAPSGREAFVVSVRDPFDAVIDLCAWLPDGPRQWWLRKGVGAVLGAVVADYANAMDQALQIFGSPLDWVRTGGQGAVVLDWHASALWALHLSGVEKFLCADREIAAHLDDVTEKECRPKPEIRVFLIHRRLRFSLKFLDDFLRDRVTAGDTATLFLPLTAASRLIVSQRLCHTLERR